MTRVPSRRGLAVIVAAVGAAAIVAAAVSRAGGDQERVGAASGSTSRDASTSTTSRSEDDEDVTSTTSSPTVGAPSTTEPPDFVAEPIGDRRAVVVTPTETASIDLAANTIRRVPHSRPIGQQFGLTMQPSGDVVFVLAHRQLYSVPSDVDTSLRSIGEGLLLLRSETAGRAWVAREARGGFVLEEIDREGRTVDTTLPLPADSSPHAVVRDSVVLSSPDGVITLWDRRSGRVEWSSPTSSHVVAAAGGRVVWQRSCSSPLCLLHVLDVATRSDVTIPSVSDGSEFYPDDQLISPSGRYLAAMVGYAQGDTTPFKLRVIDLDTGLMSDTDAFEPARLLWSPDDKWLFVGGDGNPTRPLRWAYRVDGLDVRPVDIRVPADFVALGVAIV